MRGTGRRSESRLRRLVRLGWPWAVVALCTGWGAGVMGFPGALILGGLALFLYGAVWRAVPLGTRSLRRLAACLVPVMIGAGLVLLGGYLAGSAPVVP